MKPSELKCEGCKCINFEVYSDGTLVCVACGKNHKRFIDKAEVLKIIDKIDEKHTDYYSKDCICEYDINKKFTEDSDKDNGWWINLEDYSDIIKELKKKVQNGKT